MIAQQVTRRVAEELRREIEELLGSVGFLCRIFGRGKTQQSLGKKLSEHPEKYSNDGKLVQDVIGIRVVLYFPEDIPIVQEILCGKYRHDPSSSTIDRPDTSIFSVTRHNLIFKIPPPYEREIVTATHGAPIDCTFEVQIRTILSEGWHEVDHDLRYKQKANWIGHDDLSRSFNGIVATLETAEWSMRKILDDLAYRQYKEMKWGAMLYSVLRMRISSSLSGILSAEFDRDTVLAKEMLRVDRRVLFRSLTMLAPRIPITLDNLVFLWNHVSIGNENVSKLCPQILRETFEAAFPLATKG